ncbi:MAG TPA: hypothetical protein VJ698_13570 [Noviherbaspirillum sp.]|uniref:hypothetical protein n=1 Tax=Noviherbaspirillum sp. TaxID=1926288 RepID=UPI002B4659AB|nr:hypothetical protein [Noviherbaspirillum sp.]HJV86497.1 hypothetical protein [Noviherbaspirillum sp.]
MPGGIGRLRLAGAEFGAERMRSDTSMQQGKRRVVDGNAILSEEKLAAGKAGAEQRERLRWHKFAVVKQPNDGCRN